MFISWLNRHSASHFFISKTIFLAKPYDASQDSTGGDSHEMSDPFVGKSPQVFSARPEKLLML